jgi:hypothetical protein
MVQQATQLSSSFVTGAGVTGAGNRGGRIGSSRARHSTCFVCQDQGTRPFIPHFRAQRSSVLLFVARRQAGMKSSLKGLMEVQSNVFIWRTEYRMLRHARPLVGWIGERRNRTLVTPVSMRGRHRCRRYEFRKSGVGIKVRKGSTMFRPTIVIWLVLLVLALTVVAFVTRLVEKYRLADRFSRVREKPSLSPKATHPILKQQ